MKYNLGPSLEGKTYGQLTVLKEAKPVTRNSRGGFIRRWLTKCSCGNLHEVNQMHLTRKKGGTRSCGCIGKRKLFKTKSTKHYRRLYNVWYNMLYRCNNPQSSDYHKYGQRGIKVCRSWRNYANFYNDMAESYKPGLTIERVNVNSHYKSSNCIWIKNEDQAKNRRTTVWIEGKCAKDACKEAGINYCTFQAHKKRKLNLTPTQVFKHLVDKSTSKSNP